MMMVTTMICTWCSRGECSQCVSGECQCGHDRRPTLTVPLAPDATVPSPEAVGAYIGQHVTLGWPAVRRTWRVVDARLTRWTITLVLAPSAEGQ